MGKTSPSKVFAGRIAAGCAACLLVAVGASAGGPGERPGEIGPQVGLRWLDGDIVPAGDSGLDPTWGVQGAWTLNERWAIFGDVNRSSHDSIELCVGAEYCSALTPVVRVDVLTVGLERRLRAGPSGGQWVVGLGTGMEDLRWNGIRVHHGILALNIGRRFPVASGIGRVSLRVDTGFSGRTDNQLEGVFDSVRVTNVALLVGWGLGFGSLP